MERTRPRRIPAGKKPSLVSSHPEPIDIAILSDEVLEARIDSSLNRAEAWLSGSRSSVCCSAERAIRNTEARILRARIVGRDPLPE